MAGKGARFLASRWIPVTQAVRPSSSILEPFNRHMKRKGEMPKIRMEYKYEERLETSAETFKACMKSRMNSFERKKLQKIWEEVEMARAIDPFIPTLLRRQDWELLIKKDQIGRLQYLLKRGESDLKLHSQISRNREAKKRIAEHNAKIAEQESQGKLVYGLSHNAILLRHNEVKKKQFQEANLAHSESLECPRFALDGSKVRDVRPEHRLGGVMEIQRCYSALRNHGTLARLHVTSLPFNAPWWEEEMGCRIKSLSFNGSEPLGLSCHSEHFLGLGTKRVVLINPFAHRELDGPLDEETLYVVGNVIHNSKQNFSYLREFGIETKSLPLDRFLTWRRGGRNLQPRFVLKILMDVFKSGGDWETAIKDGVPSVNTMSGEELEKWKKGREDDMMTQASRNQRLEYLLANMDGGREHFQWHAS